MSLLRVTFLPKKGYCRAVVWERDTYRRTGRGKTGFEMHYTRRQCKRKEMRGAGHLCAQHYGMERLSPRPSQDVQPEE